jgi:hypothetical protein
MNSSPAWASTTPRLFNLDTGEVIYRAFMGFYGLLFPAYVYLCMLPFRSHLTPPTRRHLLIFAIAVLLALPFFWLGFIQHHYLFLLPGLAIVLLARLLTPKPLEC